MALNLTRIEQKGCAACGGELWGAVLGCQRCGTWVHESCYTRMVAGAIERERLSPGTDVDVAATMILCRGCRS